MRLKYFGNKWSQLQFIKTSIEKYGIMNKITSMCDLFAGTGAVAWMFANKPNMKYVWANDIMYYAYVTLKSRLSNKSTSNVTKYNHITPKKGFIYRKYVRDSYKPFFHPQDAQKIDAIRQVIPETDYDALASLLDASYHAATIAGHFQTAMQHTLGTKPTLRLKPIMCKGKVPTCKVKITNNNVLTLKFNKRYDFTYLDPPYSFNYSYYYHLLETIARGDRPEVYGKYNIRLNDNDWILRFHTTSEASKAFTKLCELVDTKYLGVSYNEKNAHLSLDDLKSILKQTGYHNITVYRNKNIRTVLGTRTELFIMCTKR